MLALAELVVQPRLLQVFAREHVAIQWLRQNSKATAGYKLAQDHEIR